MNDVNTIDQNLIKTPWLEHTVVQLSKGKKGTHATVAQSVRMTLAGWLEAQTRKPREGTLTADQYVVADKERRNADKANAGGAWYSFAQYDANHRHGNNWHGTNIVVIDADAKFGNKEGPQYSFTGAKVRARLEGLQFVALPTHSYTDEVPRWRIIIPLSEVVTDRTQFAAVARHLSTRLDGYVDPRTYTPEQYWFSMSAPKGEWSKRLSLVMVEG